ncbi:MAG: hypothetical protein ABR526_11480, partial [Chthoniobacterales bacterium]
LIPSKRVDRIFPVIPPLCLLSAAALSNAWSNEQLRKNSTVWAAAALVTAVVFATGYTAHRVVRSYHSGNAALSEFAADVRQEAGARNWRYEVVGGRDEGLLLYLRRTHFLKLPDAIARWNSGALDAVVVPTAQVQEFLAEVAGARVEAVPTRQAANARPPGYALIKREP